MSAGQPTLVARGAASTGVAAEAAATGLAAGSDAIAATPIRALPNRTGMRRRRWIFMGEKKENQSE